MFFSSLKSRLYVVSGFLLLASISYGHEVDAPKTQLESLIESKGALVVNGRTVVGTVPSQTAVLHVEARESFRVNSKVVARGLAFSLQESQGIKRQQIAFVDADEIEPLLNAIRKLAVVSNGISPLENFEMVFHTKGDLRISAFNTVDRRVEVQISVGSESPVSSIFQANDLTRLRSLIMRAQLYL